MERCIVDLILIPHPKMQHPEAIELDYSMEDGKLGTEYRAALVGYLHGVAGVIVLRIMY